MLQNFRMILEFAWGAGVDSVSLTDDEFVISSKHYGGRDSDPDYNEISLSPEQATTMAKAILSYYAPEGDLK